MAGSLAHKEWKKVFNQEHLEALFSLKLKNSTSTGIDWVTTEKLEQNLSQEIGIILRKCASSSYHFTRYREMLISKGAGKIPRCISIPTVRDKLTLSAVNEVLTAVYGANATTPMPQVIIREITDALKSSEYDSFIKTDIETFYASINHELLIKQVHKKIRKEQICDLITKSIKTATVKPNASIKTEGRTSGIPEGLSISNILANVYLQPIDEKYRSLEGCRYWRYVDDILILAPANQANNIRHMIEKDMSKRHLSLSKDKTIVGKLETGFEYLGYYLLPEKTSVRQSSIINFERTIESIFRSFSSAKKPNPEYLQWKINLKITGFILDNHKYGWVFFYSQINDLSCLAHLDWLIKTLCDRFQVKDIQFKTFMKTYHEITKALHSTDYVPNLDTMTIEEKRNIVQNIYGENVKDENDSFVEMRFRLLMKKEIRDIQKDVQPFS